MDPLASTSTITTTTTSSPSSASSLPPPSPTSENDAPIVQTSRFFQLPRELRDWIYAYVFSDPAGLRYEYGTARLVSSNPSNPHHYWALRTTCRQARRETVDSAFRHGGGVVFDNLGSRRIARPNYRKYFNRWDTEYSEQDPLDPARDAVPRPVADRVRSFLSRVRRPQQRRLLTRVTVAELRPLDHVAALLDAFDAFALPAVTLTLVLVPSVVGTLQFEERFPRALERLFVKRWFRASRHTVRVRLDDGFVGLEDWIAMEFPTASNAPVQQALLRQLGDLRRLADAVNSLKRLDGDGADELTLQYLPTSFLLLN